MGKYLFNNSSQGVSFPAWRCIGHLGRLLHHHLSNPRVHHHSTSTLPPTSNIFWESRFLSLSCICYNCSKQHPIYAPPQTTPIHHVALQDSLAIGNHRKSEKRIMYLVSRIALQWSVTDSFRKKPLQSMIEENVEFFAEI